MDAQDPLHPLGIWSADHFSTDNYYWRVTEGTGAFGPGGIPKLPKRRNTNMCFLKSCKLEIIPTGEERPGFDHTTFDQIGHYAYTSTQHHQGHLDVGRTCDITGRYRVFFYSGPPLKSEKN